MHTTTAMRLKGTVTVVTGGTTGLGRRIAEAFLREGGSVVVAARSEHQAADILGSAAGRAAFLPVDVRDRDSVEELMGYAAERFGGLDIVVANAGVSRPGPASNLARAHWDEVVATNLTGVFHRVQAAVPYLERSSRGRLITVSSVLADRATPGASAYCATKAAVEALTKVCALELAAKGITANCLAPGLIDEGMGKALAGNEQVWPHYQTKLAMGRMGSAEEVASAAVFLAGEESRYVNGHVLEINGGLRW